MKQMKKVVSERVKRLLEGSEDQYLIFGDVSRDDLDHIDANRTDLGRGIRFTHYVEEKLLIVKTPSPIHEIAHRTFGSMFEKQTWLMDMCVFDLYHLGAARVQIPRRTSKESDSSYAPNPPQSKWPTFVIEAGVSETLLRLRVDAQWWLSNSDGLVKIVMLLEINRPRKEIRIEQWENDPPEVTRRSTRRTPAQTPKLITEAFIDASNNVTGGPFTLDFQKIFLQPPVSPQQDITYSPEKLAKWATNLWAYPSYDP